MVLPFLLKLIFQSRVELLGFQIKSFQFLASADRCVKIHLCLLQLKTSLVEVRILLVELSRERLVSLEESFFPTCTFLEEFPQKAIIRRQLLVLVSGGVSLIEVKNMPASKFSRQTYLIRR